MLPLFNLPHSRDCRSTTSRRETLRKGTNLILFWPNRPRYLSSGCGCNLAISAAEHAGGSRAHHSALLWFSGPGQAPSRLLWAPTVAKSGNQLRDGVLSSLRQPGRWKSHEQDSYLLLAAVVIVLKADLRGKPHSRAVERDIAEREAQWVARHDAARAEAELAGPVTPAAPIAGSVIGHAGVPFCPIPLGSKEDFRSWREAPPAQFFLTKPCM